MHRALCRGCRCAHRACRMLCERSRNIHRTYLRVSARPAVLKKVQATWGAMRGKVSRTSEALTLLQSVIGWGAWLPPPHINHSGVGSGDRDSPRWQ